MENYETLLTRQKKEFEKTPATFVFTKNEFISTMRAWGLDPEKDTDKIARIGDTGCIYLLSESDKVEPVIMRHAKELNDAIAADKTGAGFIKEMFTAALRQSDYKSTRREADALEILGLTINDVANNSQLAYGLSLAKKAVLSE